MRIWLNGQVLDARTARLHPLDRGFLYGDGLFETLRCYRGKPFLLGEHLDRLEAGAARIALPMPGRETLGQAVEAVLDANNLRDRDARLRVTVSRGAGGSQLWPEQPGPPTVLVTAQPVDVPEWLYDKGARAIVASGRVVSGAPKLKSTSFQPHVLARAEAARAGAWEALLCNERGELAEGAASNVFVRQGKAFLTPPIDAGLLPGITRAVVQRLAPSLGIEPREEPLRVEQLLAAEEAFLTSSVAEIIPLVEVGGMPIGKGQPGEATRALLAAYRDLARGFGNGKSLRIDIPK